MTSCATETPTLPDASSAGKSAPEIIVETVEIVDEKACDELMPKPLPDAIVDVIETLSPNPADDTLEQKIARSAFEHAQRADKKWATYCERE